MSDKTELLTVEVEKHPILYDKGRRDFKDAEKKKNACTDIRLYLLFLLTPPPCEEVKCRNVIRIYV